MTTLQAVCLNICTMKNASLKDLDIFERSHGSSGITCKCRDDPTADQEVVNQCPNLIDLFCVGVKTRKMTGRIHNALGTAQLQPSFPTSANNYFFPLKCLIRRKWAFRLRPRWVRGVGSQRSPRGCSPCCLGLPNRRRVPRAPSGVPPAPCRRRRPSPLPAPAAETVRAEGGGVAIAAAWAASASTAPGPAADAGAAAEAAGAAPATPTSRPVAPAVSRRSKLPAVVAVQPHPL